MSLLYLAADPRTLADQLADDLERLAKDGDFFTPATVVVPNRYVKKWLRRFNETGLEGIAVKKRGPQGGPRPRFTPSQVEDIVCLATRPPASLGYAFKAWTPQKLATAANSGTVRPSARSPLEAGPESLRH